MSDATPYKPPHWRKNRGSKVSIEGLPTPEELAQQPHTGDDADRFSLYTPEQIEVATKNVRLDISFEEVIKIRDQAEMIKAAMDIILALTKQHDIGSTNQRIETRREAHALGQKLSLFNNKTPYGFSKKKRRS
jgi:hypothetical protein